MGKILDITTAAILSVGLLGASCTKVPEKPLKPTEIVEQKAYYQELMEIGSLMAQDYNLANIARGPHSYKRAYESLMSTHEFSQEKLKKTDNDLYRAIGVITLMQAAQTLLSAGNNIVNGTPLGDQDRSKNIETAISHYLTALNLRKELDDHNNPFPNLNIPGRGPVEVAESSFIQLRLKSGIGEYTKCRVQQSLS